MSDIAAQTGLPAPDRAREIDDRIVVEQALRCLKPDDRIVIALRYARDLKLEDAAEILGMPTATFKSRLRAAKKRLRTQLREAGSPGEGR